MNHLKSFVALAGVGLMAVLGAGTASAETTACKATTEPCTSAWPVGTKFVAHLESGTHTTITPTGIFPEDVTCKKSTIEGKIETATTPTGKLSKFTHEECVGGVITVTKPGTFTIHHDSEHNGRLTLAGGEYHIEQNGVPCTFGGTITDGLTLTAGNPARIDVTAETPGLSGFPCPPSIVIHATYIVTEPAPLYITTGV